MSIKAVGVTAHGSESRLEIIEIAKPVASASDLLVKISAVALNPIDVKLRSGSGDGVAAANGRLVLGWDGSGVVEAVGAETKGFKVGDEVFFAGSLSRDGCWAEYVAVDHRICALKPKNVDHLTAASMPLTTLTAWETFEDKFHVHVPAPGSATEKKNASKSVLIIAGAGGVGSIAIQLAKKVFKFGKVITTAGRKDSHDWCVKMGADLVLDRSKDWKTQLQENGVNGVDFIFACSSADDILAELVDISNPWGHICSIVPPHKPYNVGLLFGKCLTFSFEYMSARPSHNFEQERQGEIFAAFAKYVEDGTIQPWIGTTYDKLTVENVKAAHVLQQSGTAIGKIALNAVF